MATGGDQMKPDLDILLVGPKKGGKSATTISILDQGQQLEPNTTDVFTGKVDDTTVRIVDVPGFDLDDSTDDFITVRNSVSEALKTVTKGFDVVLFVVPFNKLPDENEKQSFIKFKTILDAQDFTKHSVLIMTHGDELQSGNIEIEDWLKNQERDAHWFPAFCDGRIVLFNNVTDDEECKHEQIQNLMDSIEDIDKTSKYFPKIFRQRSEENQKAFVDIRKQVVDYERIIHELIILEGLLLGFPPKKEMIKYQVQKMQQLLTEKKIYESNEHTHIKTLGTLAEGVHGKKQETYLKVYKALEPIRDEIQIMIENIITLKSAGEDQETTNILLMGATGQGKSATANSILGREKFVSKGGGDSVTKDVFVGYKHHMGKAFKVVDVPGFNDTEAGHPEEVLAEALTKSFFEVNDGVKVILLVISFNQRTVNDIEHVYRGIMELVGYDAFKKNGILAITFGDTYTRENMGLDFKTIIKDNETYTRLLEACGDRYVLFDNVTQCIKTKHDQLKDMFQEIDKIEAEPYNLDYCRLLAVSSAERDLKERCEISKEVGQLEAFMAMLLDNTPNDVKQELINKMLKKAKDIKSRLHKCPQLKEHLSVKVTEIIDCLENCKANNKVDPERIKEIIGSANEVMEYIQRQNEKDMNTTDTVLNKFKQAVLSAVKSPFTNTCLSLGVGYGVAGYSGEIAAAAAAVAAVTIPLWAAILSVGVGGATALGAGYYLHKRHGRQQNVGNDQQRH